MELLHTVFEMLSIFETHKHIRNTFITLQQLCAFTLCFSLRFSVQTYLRLNCLFFKYWYMYCSYCMYTQWTNTQGQSAMTAGCVVTCSNSWNVQQHFLHTMAGKTPTELTFTTSTTTNNCHHLIHTESLLILLKTEKGYFEEEKQSSMYFSSN